MRQRSGTVGFNIGFCRAAFFWNVVKLDLKNVKYFCIFGLEGTQELVRSAFFATALCIILQGTSNGKLKILNFDIYLRV
jgi:hypothetical protein